jgi:hypothetical protein
MTTPDLSKLTVVGPFWSADVEVVTLDAPRSNLALRRLFLDTTARKALGGDKVLVPGTLLALCLTRHVQVTPATGAAATYEWQRMQNAPVPPLATFANMRDAIRSGAANLLLLEADPTGWAAQAGGKLPPLTCLAGDISLDALQPQKEATQRLYAALSIQAPASASVRPPGKLSVHASGLSILGSIRLPWQSDLVAAMFQLTRVLPPPDTPAPAFRLLIETERLTQDELNGLITAAQTLSGMLNPHYPLNQPPQPTAPAPHWATLELVNPAVPPRIVWPIPKWGTLGQLAFERGEINLLLSDSPPYDADSMPDSLAQILPDEVTIRLVDGTLVVTVRAGNTPNVVPDLPGVAFESPPDALVYRYNAGDREWIDLCEIPTAFSPTETPALLRTAHDLPVPEWDRDAAAPLAQPVLWGFTPLDDGWAQLPIPNLTEQIYLDANLAQLDAVPSANDDAGVTTAGIRGAVSFTNRTASGGVTNPAEQPWTVTLTDTVGLAGIWTLSPAGAGLTLSTIKLVVAQPALTLNGFFWLSADRPTVADALPSFDNWVSGLRSIPLVRVSTRVVAGKLVTADLFPSLIVLRLHELVLRVPPAVAPPPVPAEPPEAGSSEPPAEPLPPPDALLESWSISFDVDNPTLIIRERGAPAVFATLLDRLCGGTAPVLPPALFSAYEPLVWRRHRNLPFVQALALTQSINPPNEPISGRQFAPFALPTHQPAGLPLAVPDNWRFGVAVAKDGPTSGASTWPRLQNPAQPQPAAEWRTLPDLPLALLSLPGLQLDPSVYGAASGLQTDMLPLQYRYDLPYTDEIQALAQAPKERRRPDAVSPLPDEPPPEPPKPLTRETYVAHWRKLSEQASLAAVDAVIALQKGEADGVGISGLIEPLTWPVTPTSDLRTYPGVLTLAEAGAGGVKPLELRGDLIAPDAAGSTTPGASSTALQGISGQFFARTDGTISQTGAAGAAAFLVTAGSMAAHANPDSTFRDQRGLSRAVTIESDTLLRTNVRLEASAGASDTVELTSTRTAWQLEIEPGHSWQLWFRDLPTRNSSFQRADHVTSPAAQDVNDPEALSREFNYLNGYEWRLAEANLPGANGAALRLCGLEFFPLVLEQLDLAGDTLTKITLIGRLQLPLNDQPSEIADLGNAVRVTFTRSNGRLLLSDVALVSSMGEWPLALNQGELSEAPRIVWQRVGYDAITHAITLSGAQLRFHLFDVEWQIGVKQGTARFTAGTKSIAPALDIPTSPEPIALAEAALTLQLIADTPAGSQDPPKTPAHSATIALAVRLGRALAAADGSGRSAFTAKVQFALLPVSADVAPVIISATLFDDIVLRSKEATASTIELIAAAHAIEFAWDAWEHIPAGIQILPGAPIGGDAAPGCAALTFDAIATAGIPTLKLRVAYVEAVLHARWGTFLQTDVPASDHLLERVYGSSAGDLSLGYTAHASQISGAITWEEDFLLNGLVELKSLISWPSDLRFDPAQALLTLPPARTNGTIGALSHARHTMRVLLNQDHIPATLLVLSDDPALLFNLADDRPWQTLAVVEHQLIDVRETQQPASAPQLQLGADRRWTVLQEVRVMTPTVLRGFLAKIGDPALRSFDPIAGLAALTESGDGYFAPALRAALLAEIDRRGTSAPYLLIEASAPHWLRHTFLKDARPTDLQYLPGGSQHAILSGPDDYTPAAPLTPDSEWMLLITPFLGRLQPLADDDLAGTQPLAGPLAVDPVLALRRGLAQPARPSSTPLAFALAHRGDIGPVEVRIALLDTAAGRTWARLDTLTLAESWFRLQAPFPEPQPARIPSIMAALPDTPARASRSIALRRAFDVFRPFVPPADVNAFRLAADDTFRYELPPELSGAELIWRRQSMLAPSSVRDVRAKAAPRVAAGLQALYTFAENSGALVANQTSAGHTLDLTIQNPGNVTWSNGGLTIQTPTVITSAGAVGDLVAACRATNEISIEVWMIPADKTPLQLSRILSIADDPVKRNVELLEEREDDQRSVRYTLRLRTNKTGEDAKPPLQTPKLPRASTPQHVVYTRDAAGMARLYVNGIEQVRAPIPGDFSTWDASYHLVLGNTLDGARPWRGTYQSVAIYSQALTPDDVKQSYTALSLPIAGAWHTTAALLYSSGLIGPSSDQTTAAKHYPAATLLPARLTVDLPRADASVSVKNAQPLSFAISPYAGMSFRRAPAQKRRVLVSAELVCVDPATGQLRPVANRFFEDQTTQPQHPDPTIGQAQSWAREIARQLAPESPIALLRLREIYALLNDTTVTLDTATIVTEFHFGLVPDITPPPKLSRRVARLRAEPKDLRFREGHYGGNQIPDALESFEVAPPQITGTQPIYLTERPNAPAGAPANGSATQPAVPGAWPWGLSALRFSVCYTAQGRGIVGVQLGAGDGQTSVTPTLWWQAIQYGVQYRSALHETPLFSLDPALASALRPGAVTPALLTAFAAKNIPLAAGSTITPDAVNWLIDDLTNNVRYVVRITEIDARVFRRAAPSAGLPAQFRAAPIRSFLPVLPNPWMPAQPPSQFLQPADPGHTSVPAAMQAWQPVLPGSLRYFLLGARSGAMLAVRTQVIRQNGGALVSGSLPIQHRVPRPAPLPRNRAGAETVALQTWASYFEPEKTVLISRDPIDETFYAATATQAPMRLQLQLITPAHGTIPAEWDGTLIFQTQHILVDIPPTTLTLRAAGETFVYTLPVTSIIVGAGKPPDDKPDDPAQVPIVNMIFTPSPTQIAALQRQLAALGASAEVLVQLKITPAGAFRQTLTFALRVSDPVTPPLPLDPYTIHFEDPEYNRALVTQAGRAERLVKLTKQGANESGLFMIALTTDRRSYNSFSPLALRYDWDNQTLQGNPPKPGTKLKVLLQRVTSKGVTDTLVVTDATTDGEMQVLSPGELLSINLLDLRVGNALALQPDDKLRIKLMATSDTSGWGVYQIPPHVNPEDSIVQIDVDIVAEPVIPAPEAAYALLRQQTVGGEVQVECTRFAWGPNASRIELISKDDLSVGVVRRRAVFQWRDVARSGAVIGYALQKIATNGATHIPMEWEKEKPGTRPPKQTGST